MDYAHTTKPLPSDVTDDDTQLLHDIRDTFAHAVLSGAPLFQTQHRPLWEMFVQALPDSLRQIYACHACRHFVERYGHLVTIDPASGATTSVMWQQAPAVFLPAIAALQYAVEHAPVTGVFLSADTVWGTPQTGPWAHFAVHPPLAMVYAKNMLTTHQSMAEKQADYGMLQRGLAEFPLPAIQQAHALLSSEHLYRNEKHLGVATWLLDLHTTCATTKHKRHRDNLVWLAVATAPPGFCHVRSTMIGTLLEDLTAGMAFEDVRRRFADKMHPLQYQRPTAAPSEGNIAQAEQRIAELGLTASLQRRFAQREDVQEWVWQPRAPTTAAPAPNGVFTHLRPQQRQSPAPMATSVTAITWAKFLRVVLPQAQQMAYYVPQTRATYITLVTAADPTAPPLLQWDSNAQRNPVSWFVYHGGSPPTDFGLTPQTWHPVSGITRLPARWGTTQNAHHGDGMILVLDGAQHSGYTGHGGLFFPETVRSELHGIRSTLEAYVRQGTIAGKEAPMVCGVDLRMGLTWDVLVRVHAGVLVQSYRLERWD